MKRLLYAEYAFDIIYFTTQKTAPDILFSFPFCTQDNMLRLLPGRKLALRYAPCQSQYICLQDPLYEGEYSRERLVQQLARAHPKTITQLAQKDTGSSANRHMRQILRIYNGASREMSLPLKN